MKIRMIAGIILFGMVFLQYISHHKIKPVSKDFGGPMNFDKIVSIPIDEMMKGPVYLKQDDPALIRKIRADYLVPPSSEDYELENPKVNDTSMGQTKKILQLLGQKSNGFFVECGALNGETLSNSLMLERKLGWKGLLIEGGPENFALLEKKNRKAWKVSSCLSTVPYPNEVLYHQGGGVGKISNLPMTTFDSLHGHGHTVVQCLPIYSILLALNATHKVDYFSLDVEGDELEILKTIPWDKVQIKTLSVEFIHIKGGKAGLLEYMLSVGYKLFTTMHSGSMVNDFIFYHPSYVADPVTKKN